MQIKQGVQVRHRRDPGLGLGKVLYIDDSVGVPQFTIKWQTKPANPSTHAEGDLELVATLIDRLVGGDVGAAHLQPFQLRVLGRWFEARHALTGELSNQPFQMLPHQVIVTNRVVRSDPERRNWLIADDVGLGKTIEAGMIMEVLRRKNYGRFRCLIVTPAGLLDQWIEEMDVRFGRRFGKFIGSVPNDLEDRDLLVASIDTLRQERFKEALTSGTPWDLVIFDEAHHLATTTSVKRHKLARLLRDEKKARNMLFLTATPHSGNAEHFVNMLGLLREDLFRDENDLEAKDRRLDKVMIRNRKSDVTDEEGNRIFKGIAPARIIRCKPTNEEVQFYEGLQDYLRKGYNVAERLKRENNSAGRAVGFLMTTYKKLSSSSRAAIQTALRNRLRYLEGEAAADGAVVDGDAAGAPYAGQEAEDAVNRGIDTQTVGKGRKPSKSPIGDEIQQVRGLVERLNRLKGRDSKLIEFLRFLKSVPSDVKLLIFTEYRGTQTALIEALRAEYGELAVTSIHGSMGLPERRQHVAAFNKQSVAPRFMVSTEAGGEGLNMQRSCHWIINYDLPWNPARIQQRIGRVYRYGQKHPVNVVNVQLESDSDAFADMKIDEYLRRKIREITERLRQIQGENVEDLESDVLGQVSLTVPLDQVYETAVREGEAAAEKLVDKHTGYIEEMLKTDGILDLFKGLKRFDVGAYRKVAARVTTEQLLFFVRQYLGRAGQRVKTEDDGKSLSFDVPAPLIDVANRIRSADQYETGKTLTAGKAMRVTVDKQHARDSSDSRLLRFGNPLFDAMVQHVQQSDFSGSVGVASLRVDAAGLGISPGERCLCAIFDLKVLRQEGDRATIVEEELAAYLVPHAGAPVKSEALFDRLADATPGPLDVDLEEARRAFSAAWTLAEVDLKKMREGVVLQFGKPDGVVTDFNNFALAWVEATAA